MTELHNPLCGKRSQEKCYVSVCTSKKNTIYPHRYMDVFLNILSIAITWNNRADYFSQRSCRVESTRSRSITKVKQHWARLVLRWVTAWELRVVLALFTFVNTWPTEPSDLSPPPVKNIAEWPNGGRSPFLTLARHISFFVVVVILNYCLLIQLPGIVPN